MRGGASGPFRLSRIFRLRSPSVVGGVGRIGDGVQCRTGRSNRRVVRLGIGDQVRNRASPCHSRSVLLGKQISVCGGLGASLFH